MQQSPKEKFETYYVVAAGKQCGTIARTDLDRLLGKNNYRFNGNTVTVIRRSHLPRSKESA